MMNEDEFVTVSMDQLSMVSGGSDFWDAVGGALNIVTSPVTATYRGIRGTVGALQQGHSFTDSASNGLVQAAQIPNVPNLADIPANPNAPRPAPRGPGGH